MTALEQLFLDVVNLSVTASWVIAVVLVLRLILKPVPKKYVCLLWLVVLFRLFCPVTLESEFSLVPQHEEIKYEIVYTTPKIEMPSESVNAVANQTVNPILEQTSAPNPQGSVNPLQVYIFLAAWLWVMGMAVLCGYTLFSWMKMRHQLAEAVPDGGGVYLSDRITSPFVFGIVKPNIYLPFGLNDEERRWVLLHEQSHIARKDFIVKPLFWLAVILHWMNPLVWMAWHCYSRDVELACDERVTESMNSNEKWNYSNTLLQLATEKKDWHCPVAFSHNGVKQRIERIWNHKKLPKVIIGVVLMVLILCGIGLLMNPKPVMTLGAYRPSLLQQYEKQGSIIIEWGSVTVKISDPVQINEFKKQLADVQVKKYSGKEASRDIGGMIMLPYEKDGEDGAMESRLAFHTDCSIIYGGEDLQILKPEVFRAILWNHCRSAVYQYPETSFYADLNHDGNDEYIVINIEEWDTMDRARMAVYEQNGTILFNRDLYGAHADWGNYFLCKQGGKDYLLEFMPTTYQGYATYSWKLMDFDANNELRIVEEDSIDFSVNPVVTEETQQFDVDAILAFLEGVERMIRPAMLLVSTEDGVLEYSTAEQFRTRTAESYIAWWLEDSAAYQALSAQEKATVSLREKLQMKQDELLSAGSQVQLEQLADQWAQTFADRDGTGRYDLMTSDLQQKVDVASMDDDYAWWMPVWVDSKDREKGMFLRGSSPWVESWDTTLQLEDNATEAQIQIRYDMTDSAEARYVYGETLQCVRQDQTWKVAACTISVELMEQIVYEETKLIAESVKAGHETWRLDTEQVALAFVHDYLKLPEGQLSAWDEETQSFLYRHGEQTYRIALYQPLRQAAQPEQDFWAVRAYEEITDPDTYIYHDVSFDLWASLHVEK